MEPYFIMRVVERLARQQRVATIAAGVKAAHPAMYHMDVMKEAQAMESVLQSFDRETYPHGDA